MSLSGKFVVLAFIVLVSVTLSIQASSGNRGGGAGSSGSHFEGVEKINQRRLETCRKDIQRKSMVKTINYLKELKTKEAKLTVLDEVYKIWGDEMPPTVGPVYTQLKAMYDAME
ncbi:uncharacterized protein LOC116346966 [Contarinia nasturtii]|uniref:uncharacterized protein LOC116346966 n=1 Tax=Contarinia nasturtii TaxID=265458 RepID=UPI0012D432BD|nr:uncharacterized protein LOC116346966 [Contarinia nasturtii]